MKLRDRDRSGGPLSRNLLKRRDPSTQSVLSKTLCGFARPHSSYAIRSSPPQARRRRDEDDVSRPSLLSKIAATRRTALRNRGPAPARRSRHPQSTAQGAPNGSVARSKNVTRSRVLMLRGCRRHRGATASTVVRVLSKGFVRELNRSTNRFVAFQSSSQSTC